MTDNKLTIVCDRCRRTIAISGADLINTELAANILAGSIRDKYGEDNEDYKCWLKIGDIAYALFIGVSFTNSTVQVNPYIFEEFPLKEWTIYKST
jgi:hypothetical protein